MPDGEFLFELPPAEPARPKAEIKPIDVPLWTRNKARLVRDYLFLFVQITHHGTYLDAFAGPQELDLLETWAARLVLEVQQLRHFHLFEEDPAGLTALELLRTQHPDRDIAIWSGDVNGRLPELLSSGAIPPTEATFCLLDQRTFECHWTTLVSLARHKPSGHFKIELFYFLAQKWLDRALHAQKDSGPPTAWWGRGDWEQLRAMSRQQRVDAFVSRFRNELGYHNVMAWPIFERDGAGAPVMYYMIHASDHHAAPGLMRRAYDTAVRANTEQTSFGWRIAPRTRS
jgi:three-Cys-motif partner protein